MGAAGLARSAGLENVFPLGKLGRVRKPKALRSGDKVRVVAPAGAWDDGRMDRGRALLESWGLRVEGPGSSGSYR